MKTLEISKATSSLAKYSREVKSGPLIVTIHGKPIAALVAVGNADRETVSLSNNPRFLDLIERSRSHQKSEGGIFSQEMRRRLNLKKRG